VKYPASDPTPLSLGASASQVPVEYRGLHKYLKDRYADMVVLSFMQIEALMGGPLPSLAYFGEWWGSGTVNGAQSAQSRAWTDAQRTATPNLRAKNVAFERVPA
jgi:hypothetical protein